MAELYAFLKFDLCFGPVDVTADYATEELFLATSGSTFFSIGTDRQREECYHHQRSFFVDSDPRRGSGNQHKGSRVLAKEIGTDKLMHCRSETARIDK